MKFTISLIFILYFFSTNLFSQLSITSINTSKVHSCVDSAIQFSAVIVNGGGNPVTYKWSFGDGTSTETGTDLDTVNHTFTEGGGYIVRLNITDGADSDYHLLNYEIALTPNFSGTNSDRKDPMCLGQQIFLTGKVNDSTWVYEVPNENTEENAVLFSDSKPYEVTFDYRIFTKVQTIVTATDIDSIGINIVHTDMSQVKIELICPNDTSIILKDFGGTAGKFLGDPNGTESGFDYFWTNTPDNGTMNATVPAGNSLLSGTYTPEQSFNLLAGCPLNGDWKIKVTDNQANDSGYVSSTQLKFEPSLLPVKWEYKHTYDKNYFEWKGNGVSVTAKLENTGIATATPAIYGNIPYTYVIKDNFGCKQDTFLVNTVEPVSFDASPDSLKGDFDLPIQFKNTTSWATEFLWDFGDDTETSIETDPLHTYEKDGLFQALLTAGTSDGCSDTLSVWVTVTIPTFELTDIPNTFSPNGDAKNPKFKLKKEGLEGVKDFECIIYSRWGKKVAEWHSVEEAIEGWDGSVNGGRDASPGVYYYYIEAVGFNGELKTAKGFVQLFR